MPSKSRVKFDENLGDIDHLLDFHDALETLSEADGEPVPPGADVLFRAAVVLLVSHWEAYVEDITGETLTHIVTCAKDASVLSNDIKRQVASELKKAPNDLELWKVADGGWRDYLKNRLVSMQEARNRSFNTPKSVPTAEFIEKAIGLKDVTKGWTFGGLTSVDVCKKLNSLIEVRGQIAHRGKISAKIDKKWVQEHVTFVRNVAGKTGGKINSHVKLVAGSGLW